MILQVHPVNPEKRLVQNMLHDLSQGKIIIVPTDTVYALICSFDCARAMSDLYKIKQMDEDHPLSLLCSDVAMASHYAHAIPNHIFRFIKQVTPGPYTFIFKANRLMDRRGTGKKKSVGIRIVDNTLIQALMQERSIPLVATSITTAGEFHTDPSELDHLYGHRIAYIVDGGIREHEYSTILDCSDGGFVLLRQGKGSIASIESSVTQRSSDKI